MDGTRLIDHWEDYRRGVPPAHRLRSVPHGGTIGQRLAMAIQFGVIICAILASLGGYWMGRESAERDAEVARRVDYCYIGGVESDGLPYNDPSHWRCDPTDESSLRAAGYTFMEIPE